MKILCLHTNYLVIKTIYISTERTCRWVYSTPDHWQYSYIIVQLISLRIILSLFIFSTPSYWWPFDKLRAGSYFAFCFSHSPDISFSFFARLQPCSWRSRQWASSIVSCSSKYTNLTGWWDFVKREPLIPSLCSFMRNGRFVVLPT